MTNTSKVTALLADGKPRTLAQIARSARISKASAERALKQLRSSGDCVSRRQEILYLVTDVGLSRFERLQAQVQEHNEQIAERAAEALSKAKARAAVQAACSGAVPNSVFALGGQGHAA